MKKNHHPHHIISSASPCGSPMAGGTAEEFGCGNGMCGVGVVGDDKHQRLALVVALLPMAVPMQRRALEAHFA